MCTVVGGGGGGGRRGGGAKDGVKDVQEEPSAPSPGEEQRIH